MTYKIEDIIPMVSASIGLPESLILHTYKAYWKAVRNHITSLPLKEELTDEEFFKIRPNVNIPSIGKLNITLDRYRKIKEMYKLKTSITNATHQSD